MSKIRPARVRFGQWVEASGRTQGEVGKAIGASQQTVSKLSGEDSEYLPSESLARRIETATGIPWLDWYTGAKRKRLEKQIASARALRSPSP
jgi:DNA-binding XRE family transcriptional regulator